jgi:hypothetical protein
MRSRESVRAASCQPHNVAAPADEQETQAPYVAPLTQRVQVREHFAGMVDVGHRIDHRDHGRRRQIIEHLDPGMMDYEYVSLIGQITRNVR